MTSFRTEMHNLFLASIPADEMNNRNISITFQHYGWDGKGGRSMQDVGEEYFLTRERVRQVATKCSRQMAEQADKHLSTLPGMLSIINKMAPAKAERVEENLRAHGLGDDALEGVLNAAKQFNRVGKHLRVTTEFNQRFVILPDMEGSAAKVLAKARKLTSNVGMTHVHDLLPYVPGIHDLQALDYIRDVISIREDAVWLDEGKNWVWFSKTPRNRLITCLHRMLSTFSSVTLEGIRQGANRYYRKGAKTPAELQAPPAVIKSFLLSWGEATCSDAGIVRKSPRFKSGKEVLDFERLIVDYIISRPGKIAREKELENILVPQAEDKTPHPKKRNFSNALNYSPLICKGRNRGEYIANGAI